MFKDTKAFSSFAVNDIVKAKHFYGEILGLDVAEDSTMPMPLLSLSLSTGGRVMIYPKPEHSPADFTVLNFPVKDIDGAVDTLTGLGIKFESYDNEFIKTDAKGIARPVNPNQGPEIAWFKDPAGNVLAVMQER